MDRVLHYHLFIEKPTQKMLNNLKEKKCNIKRNFPIQFPHIKEQFTYKYGVYAEVKRPKFVAVGTNPDDLLLDENQMCLINITSLFHAQFNSTKSNVIITPQNMNVKPWIKNYNLRVYVKYQINTKKLEIWF